LRNTQTLEEGKKLDINKVIGRRIAELVERSDDFLDEMGWEPQTYYEARIGRRAFRASELVALARASGVPAWQFLNATRLTKTVKLGEGSKPIGSDDLLDLFRSDDPADKGLIWHAFQANREILDNLAPAMKAARAIEKELHQRYVKFKAWEE
jgi:hypothetical protein